MNPDPNYERMDRNKVCVVGATEAWPFYRLTGVYVCQANRYIQEDTGRLGFYSARLIHGVAPEIENVYPDVPLDERVVAEFAMHALPELRRVGVALDAALNHGFGEASVQVVLLSGIDDPRTATFEPVRHEGRGAWTQRQRYAYLEQLSTARTTEDLTSATGADA